MERDTLCPFCEKKCALKRRELKRERERDSLLDRLTRKRCMTVEIGSE